MIQALLVVTWVFVGLSFVGTVTFLRLLSLWVDERLERRLSIAWWFCLSCFPLGMIGMVTLATHEWKGGEVQRTEHGWVFHETYVSDEEVPGIPTKENLRFWTVGAGWLKKPVVTRRPPKLEWEVIEVEDVGKNVVVLSDGQAFHNTRPAERVVVPRDNWMVGYSQPGSRVWIFRSGQLSSGHILEWIPG